MRVSLRLPESNRRRSRRLGGTVLSAAAHAVLIGAAVYGTTGVEAAPVDPPEAPLLIFHPPRPAPVPLAAPATDRPTAPADPTRAPTVPGTTTVPAPAPLQFDVRPLDGVASFAGAPTAADFGPGVDARPAGPPGGPVMPGGASVLSELEVERAVVLLPGAPAPRYPETLRAAAVQGRVVARFVVDTLGRVEPQSVELPEASHAQFAEAVRQVLPRLRFRPAEAGGRRVRQLVQQEFRFALRE